MILTGTKIAEEVSEGGITLTPFSDSHLTTNSYDLTLGPALIRYTADVLDPKKDNEYEQLEIPETGIILDAGSFHLGASLEMVGSTNYVPIIHARSGIARLGLFVHVTADLIDIGSCGNVTFQLFATLPIRIYPKMRIAQVTFWQPKGEIKLYTGKYQGSKGPSTSRSYQDE